MPSTSSTWFWTKLTDQRGSPPGDVLRLLLYVVGGPLLIFGVTGLYKLNTFITSYCQVKSFDVVYKRRSYSPKWNITVLANNLSRDDVLNGLGTLESWAWNKINGTYPCYRSRRQSLIYDWDWQWGQPTKLKTFSILSIAITLVASATVLLILGRQRRKELASERAQEAHDQLKPIEQ